MILRLALIPLVERAIEGVHAQIKRAGTHAPRILPSYVSASVRERQNMILLQSRAFRDFCLVQWMSRSFVNELLQNRQP